MKDFTRAFSFVGMMGKLRVAPGPGVRVVDVDAMGMSDGYQGTCATTTGRVHALCVERKPGMLTRPGPSRPSVRLKSCPSSGVHVSKPRPFWAPNHLSYTSIHYVVRV